MATTLITLAKEWVKVPESLLSELKRLRSKITKLDSGLTQKNKATLLRLDSPEAIARLLDLPQKLWAFAQVRKMPQEAPAAARADRLDARVPSECAASAGQCRLHHRDGLIIALAALLPLRRANLSALTIDDSLYRVDQLWAVRIPKTKSKSGRFIDAVLLVSISEGIARHIDLFRPIFLGSTNHRGLWCSFYRGEALTDAGLYMAIRKRVGQSTGHWISLHDFARIAATSIAIYDPCNVASASQLLGHMDARVTSAHYNRARGVVASRRMALLIEAARKTRGERLNASDRRCRSCRVDIGRMVCLRSADLCLGPAHSSRQWRHLGER
jgi:integrase